MTGLFTNTKVVARMAPYNINCVLFLASKVVKFTVLYIYAEHTRGTSNNKAKRS